MFQQIHYIIAEVSGHGDIDDGEESGDEEQPTDCISKPAFKDVMNAITILEGYSLFSNFEVDLMKAVKDASCALDLDCLSNKTRSTMKDFFQIIVSYRHNFINQTAIWNF